MTASAWCEKGSDCNVDILPTTTAGPKRPVAGGFLHLIREGGRSLAQQPVFASLPHTLRSLGGSPMGRRPNGGEAHFRVYRFAFQLHHQDLRCAPPSAGHGKL